MSTAGPWTQPSTNTVASDLEELRELLIVKKQLEAREKSVRSRIETHYENGLLKEYEDFEPGTFIAPGLEFTRGTRRTYGYSKELTTKIKQMQQYEQDNDLATCKTTSYFTMKVVDRE